MGMSIGTVVSPRDRILGALDKLPPFSPVLTRLLATLADEDVSFAELAGIIETDAVLAGNLLRVVNSPLYGRISTINSVRHAVAIMGSIKVRNLVLGLSVSRRWAGARVTKKWDGRQFNMHSLAVAVLSDLGAGCARALSGRRFHGRSAA
jgi:HD-like signal output (HDOD) protein